MKFLQTIGGFFSSNLWLFGIVILVFIAIWLLGIRFIPNSKVGIVEKRIGTKMNSGTIIALNGEVGYQADLLRGGLHILPRIFYSVHVEDLITIPQGKIGYVFSRDGKALEPSQTLGKVVECDNFENVRDFLNKGGQKGPQRAILREGTYALNLAQFVVITENQTYYMPLGLPGEEEQIESMNNTISARNGFSPQIISASKNYDGRSKDIIGIVTVHDGPSMESGELIAKKVEGHDMFQNPETFIQNGGQRGKQLQVLTDGTYFINVLFATIEIIDKYEIPIGQVGVVNYFTGEEGEDLSGEEYQHGDLVEKGKKGVWAEVLQPNKYPWNPYAGRIYRVPVTNFILKWENNQNSEFGYDSKLQEIKLITKDAFQPALPLSVVIHIDYKDAPKVIQRFGDIKTLVQETIDPLVGAYFKNIGQTKTLLELVQDRSEIQIQAALEMKAKFAEYNLNLVEVLIGTPRSSEEDKRIDKIYEMLQDRQIAKEEAITLEAQRTAQLKQREFAEAEKAAEMQGSLTESEMQISITENNGKAAVRQAEQNAIVIEKNAAAQAAKTEIDAKATAKQMTIVADAEAYKVERAASAESRRITMTGEANADSKARNGIAEGIAVREKVDAMGPQNLVTMEVAKAMAEALKEYPGQLVPNSVISMGGENESGYNLVQLLLTKMLNPETFKDFANGTKQSDAAKEVADRMRSEVLAKASKSAEGDEAKAESANIESAPSDDGEMNE